ncbi:MAG: hypothetical protein HYX35_01765 [Proteobacteria bacterium]|nr:hypothetical protein [Pseudomonadota bacterium]
MFTQCMINECTYCAGTGQCKDPPCESADHCSTCDAGCTTYSGRTGPSVRMVVERML